MKAYVDNKQQPAKEAKPLLALLLYANPDYYPPTVRAAEILSQSYRVVIICRNFKEPLVNYPEGVQVLRLGKYIDEDRLLRRGMLEKTAEYFCFLWKSRRLVRSLGAKLVYAYDMHALSAGYISAAGRGIPLVYHNHDLAESRSAGLLGRLVKKAELHIAGKADLAVFPEKKRAGILKKDAKLAYEPLIAPNTPLLLKEPPRSDLLPGILRREGWQGERPVVLYQGSVSPSQSILQLIQSMKYWGKGVLVIIGPCSFDFKEKIHEEAQRNGLSKKVFLLPLVGFDRLISMTAAADIGCALPSPSNINLIHYSTASCKLFEYLSCGVPVVTTPDPDLIPLFTDRPCLRFADASDPASIGAAIRFWVDNPKEFSKAREAARQSHLSEFHYERSFKEVLKKIDEFVTRPKETAAGRAA